MSTQIILILSFVVLLTTSDVFCGSCLLRIGIMVNVKEFQLGTEKNSKLLMKTSEGKIVVLKLVQPLVVKFVENNKIKIFDTHYKLPVKFSSYKGKVQINNRVYPGEILVSFSTNGVNVINIVDMERYLYGVVPYEVSHNWTDEMFKVQAIIARTYALLNLNRHQAEGFDLCAEVHCQVYKGISKTAHVRVKKAVDSTRGMVVVDEVTGKPVQTYYHAACGGGTENVTEVWNSSIERQHLVGVDCSYCDFSPYSSWKCEFVQNKFVKLLEVNGFPVGKVVKKIKIVSITKKGRAKEIEIVGDVAAVTLRGEVLRKILGYNVLRSTKIRNIDVDKEKITFYGKGWGHGVGLCQWGANYLSRTGWKFDKIIKYYYPRVSVKKVY